MKLFPANLIFLEFTVCMAFSISRPCHADEAQVLYKKGVERFKADDYDAASTAFKEAYRLKPTWKIYYNIGQCEAAAKRYGTALESFEAFLAEGGDEIADDRREEVIAEVQRLRQMVGSLTVIAPDGASIFIDGIERGKSPIIGKLLETAGKQHEIWFVEDGEKSEVKLFKINSAETLEINLSEPSPNASASPRPSDGEGAPQSPAGTSNQDAKTGKSATGQFDVKPPAFAGWLTVGIGAAAVAAGAVMGGLALADKKTIDDSNDCINEHCTSDQSSAIATMQQRSLAADILLFSGGAAAVAGAVLLVVHAKRSKNESSASAKLSFSPALSPDFAGMSFTGRF
jgi:hypothetical protein